MSKTEQRQLDELLIIAEEESTMNDWEKEFIESLDRTCRDRDLSEKRAECFDRIVSKHLRGE